MIRNHEGRVIEIWQDPITLVNHAWIYRLSQEEALMESHNHYRGCPGPRGARRGHVQPRSDGVRPKSNQGLETDDHTGALKPAGTAASTGEDARTRCTPGTATGSPAGSYSDAVRTSPGRVCGSRPAVISLGHGARQLYSVGRETLCDRKRPKPLCG